jgi:hypothetical protein
MRRAANYRGYKVFNVSIRINRISWPPFIEDADKGNINEMLVESNQNTLMRQLKVFA